MTKFRAGQAPAPQTIAQFREHSVGRFYDPALEIERESIARLEALAWKAAQVGPKAPITRPAGRNFADPTCEVSVPWLGMWLTPKRTGAAATLDRYLGDYLPYYNGDKAVQKETRNVARSVVQAVKALRAGRLSQLDKQVKWPRPT